MSHIPTSLRSSILTKGRASLTNRQHSFQTNPSPLSLVCTVHSLPTHLISAVPHGLQGNQCLRCFRTSLRPQVFCLPHSFPQHTEMSFLSCCPDTWLQTHSNEVSFEWRNCPKVKCNNRRSHSLHAHVPQIFRTREPKAKRTTLRGSRKMGVSVHFTINPSLPT